MAATPRIVSLLPSATEIVSALGLERALVGRSHECDFPPGLDRLPVLTRPRLDVEASSGEIDRTVRSLLEAGLSVYEVDAERLRALAPDVVLTQTQCEVCAVTPADLDAALRGWTKGAPTVVSLAPRTLAEVWSSFRAAATALGVEAAGDALVGRTCETVAALQARVAGRSRPAVACIDWIDPPMAAGHWVPDLVEAAGGTPVLTRAGAPSAWITREDLARSEPDVVVIMPCGFDHARAVAETVASERARRWLPARARDQGRVALADGHQFFNRPGPRLVDSLEILIEILHRDVRLGHRGRGWSPLEDDG